MNDDIRIPLRSMRLVLATGAAVAGCVLTALPAGAQTNVPSYAAAVPSYATGEERLRGRVVAFDGKYGLAVRDEHGFVDNVRLHDGTIINPTGLRLSPGQSVTVLGRNAGKTFEANEIDTPYASYGAVPVYAYGFPAYGYYPYGYGRYRPYSAFGFGYRGRGFGAGGWF